MNGDQLPASELHSKTHASVIFPALQQKWQMLRAAEAHQIARRTRAWRQRNNPETASQHTSSDRQTKALQKSNLGLRRAELEQHIDRHC
jgi:hypothetical protein